MQFPLTVVEGWEMKPDILSNTDCMQTPTGIIGKESITKTTGINL